MKFCVELIELKLESNKERVRSEIKRSNDARTECSFGRLNYQSAIRSVWSYLEKYKSAITSIKWGTDHNSVILGVWQ